MPITLTDVELRHLSALRAVAEEGTFARAAHRLGYTQSAVSQQISMLERLVGAPLFERHGGPRPAVLTGLGQRLVQHARSILDQVAAAEADLDLFVAGRVGSVSIGTFQSASVRIVPDVLRRFRIDRPDVEVKLVEEVDEAELVDGLLARRLDAVFLTMPVVDTRIRVQALLEDPFVVVTPAAEPVGASGAALAPAQLDQQPLIADAAGTCSLMMENGLRRLGVEPRIVFRSHDNAALQALVRCGVGWAVMPALAVDTHDPGVRVHRLDPAMEPRQVGIAVLAGRDLPPALTRLLELTAEVGAELVADHVLLASPGGG